MDCKQPQIAVDAQNLTVTYIDPDGNPTHAVQDVTLAVPEHSIVAVVGPSGCGKSTLLRTIAGFIELSDGCLETDYLRFSMIPQQFAGFPWLTVFEHVRFGLRGRGLSKSEQEEEVVRLLELVQLSGHGGKYIKELSGGMQQRVMLATVLAYDPDVLLMDEPFSALDAQTREQMQELLLTVWGETKKTIIFVTHAIEEAIFLADKVYVMSAGPGTITKQVDIDLPRPRNFQMRFSKQFSEYHKQLSEIIRRKSVVFVP
ncbi:ABC transporter ATP-binding protein [Patescibacteria group bacterium]